MSFDLVLPRLGISTYKHLTLNTDINTNNETIGIDLQRLDT